MKEMTQEVNNKFNKIIDDYVTDHYDQIKKQAIKEGCSLEEFPQILAEVKQDMQVMMIRRFKENLKNKAKSHGENEKINIQKPGLF